MVTTDTVEARVAADPASYLSIIRAAAFLGVSRRTIYNWIAQQRVPVYYTPSGTVRLKQADLLSAHRPAHARVGSNAGTFKASAAGATA